MKKIFAAIKKFVTKAIDKAKELWAKAKEWLNKTGKNGATHKETIRVAATVGGLVTTLAAASICVGYQAGKIKTMCSPLVQNALHWWVDPMSKDIRESSYSKAFCIDAKGYEETNIGGGVKKIVWPDKRSVVDFESMAGYDSPVVSDFGKFGDHLIANGYSADEKVFGAFMVMAPMNPSINSLGVI